jgi:hypothetical protein
MISNNVVLRLATKKDVGAIIALLLTSFREFPLFDTLYSPLREHPDYAKDTVFFWGRRVKLALADPNSVVLVTEMNYADAQSIINTSSKSKDENALNCKMLNWCEREGLKQENSRSGNLVIGFAIWRLRDWNIKHSFNLSKFLESMFL